MSIPAQIAFSVSGANLRVYSAGAVAGDAPMQLTPTVEDSYLQPDGVSTYFRPDGESIYLQPA